MNILLSDVLIAYRGVCLKPGIQNRKKTPPNTKWFWGLVIGFRTLRARSIQPKFRPVRPGKEDHLKRWTCFFIISRDQGRDPFNQTFRKFRSKTQWIGSVQPEKFRKNGGAIHSTKIPTGPTGKRGPPQKVDLFFRNFSGWTEPIHWVLDWNFQKFWLNGSCPEWIKFHLIHSVSKP